MISTNQSAEDYLETIYILQQRIGDVRSIDIVNDTGYSKPSISIAMKKLKTKKYIDVDGHGYITLTKEGKAIAEEVYQKHCCLKQFFMMIGVDEQTASKDACNVEHMISQETFECMKTFVNNSLK